MRVGRRCALVAATVCGALAGVLGVLALTSPAARPQIQPATALAHPTQSAGRPATTAPLVPLPSTTATSVPAPAPQVLLVWTSGGLPPDLAPRVAELRGVEATDVVRGDQADLVASFDPDGVPVDAVADGWQIPLDTLAVDPATHPRFVAGAGATAVSALAPGEALLTETSARLRRLEPGSTLRLTTGEVRIVGVIDDLAGAGAELIVHSLDADRLGVGTERYLLISHRVDRLALQDELAARHLAGLAARFRTPAETTWLRHGDAVAPQALVKEAYGEFAYRDRGGRDVEISAEWRDRWIVTEAVPILGQVTCHRSVIGDLRSALDELVQANLAHLVARGDFAGCFGPRRIAPGEPLSRHAWGVAADVNVDDNPRGSFSAQDERLVEAMRRNGFGWGGTWLVPDPAHYEATVPPR